MIRFEGVLSDKCVIYRIKSSMFSVIIGIALCLMIVSPVLIIFSVLYDYNIIGSIVISLLLVLILLVLVIKFHITKKPRVNVKIELTVDSDYIEYVVAYQKKERIPLSKIKKVIKIDQCYYIIRRHGDVSTSIMAEESLLKEGSIEKFEKLFSGKIEVKK